MTQPTPAEAAWSRQAIALTILAVVIVVLIVAVVTGNFPWPHSGNNSGAPRSGTTATPSFASSASGPAPAATSAAAEPTTASSPLPLPPASALGPYRSGILTFNAQSHPTDLDAPAADPQWGRGGEKPSAGSGFDISANKLGIQPYDNSHVQWDLTPLKPTYAACAADTATDSDILEWSDVAKSNFLCIHTDGGRAAIAEITAAGSSSVTWKITVYRKASD